MGPEDYIVYIVRDPVKEYILYVYLRVDCICEKIEEIISRKWFIQIRKH